MSWLPYAIIILIVCCFVLSFVLLCFLLIDYCLNCVVFCQSCFFYEFHILNHFSLCVCVCVCVCLCDVHMYWIFVNVWLCCCFVCVVCFCCFPVVGAAGACGVLGHKCPITHIRHTLAALPRRNSYTFGKGRARNLRQIIKCLLGDSIWLMKSSKSGWILKIFLYASAHVLTKAWKTRFVHVKQRRFHT